jgi:hypothetical protein
MDLSYCTGLSICHVCLELSSENLRTSFSIIESYILLGGLEFLQVKREVFFQIHKFSDFINVYEMPFLDNVFRLGVILL